jgi:hypothetical protein
MIAALEKKSAVIVHRRGFLKTATAAAGGALLPEAAWSAQPSTVPTLANPPFDLRNDNGTNYISPVKDQDNPLPCNACTAFAVAAAVEGTSNKKNQRPATQGPDLNEMELFLRPTDPTDANDADSGGCGTSHWWPKHALARCKSKGVLLEGSSTQYLKIVEYKNLLSEDPHLNDKKNLEKTQADMKCWIRSKGPVVAVMVQYEDLFAWGKVWNDQHPDTPNTNVYAPGRILSCAPCAATASAPSARTAAAARKNPRVPIVGGHVVAIVGFDDQKKCWVCKNSWGSDWNGDGYVLIEQGDSNGPGHLGIDSCYIDLIDVWGVSFDNTAPTCP